MPQGLASATALLPRMIEAVQLLVNTESPTHDLAACAGIAEIAAELTGDWLQSPARIEVHDGCPVVRWGPDRKGPAAWSSRHRVARWHVNSPTCATK